MSIRRTAVQTLGVALGVMMLPAPARSQQIPEACRPVIEAQRKEIMTPHHAYQTDSAAGGNTTRVTGEFISTAEATYVLYHGAWKHSPMTPQAALAQFEENLANARNLACRRVGEESVGGVRTVVYTMHNETGDVGIDGRVWVAVSSGLVLRTDYQESDGGSRQRSTRYQYANVHAPAGVH